MTKTNRRRSAGARLLHLSACGLMTVGLAGMFALAPAAQASTPPDVPTGVAAAAGNATATVTWSPPADNGGPAVTSYIVTTAGPGADPPPVEVTGTAAPIDGLTNGVSYIFTVVARNSDGDSPDSQPSAAVTPRTVPGAPGKVSAVPGNGSVTLSWSPPADDGGAVVLSYTATLRQAGTLVTATTEPAPKTTTIMSGLTNGVAYTVTVVATNAAGNGPDSPPVSTVPPAVPAPPTHVTAVPGNGSADIAWLPPADTGGLTLVSYAVTIYGGGNVPGPVTVPAGQTTTTISGLTNASSYTFTVAAANTTGYGPDSAPTLAVIPNTLPGSPNGVAAAPGNGSATVQWTAPADGGSPIGSYTVTTHGPGTAPVPLTVAAPATGTSIAGLTNGASYTFTVAAGNASGQGPESAPSLPIQPRTVPAAPASVTAVPGDQSLTVSWSPSPDNGGSPVTSYIVTGRVLGVVLAHENVPASATTIRMTNLINGVGYLVEVAAVNAAGSSLPSTLPGPVIPAAPTPAAVNSAGPGYWMLGIDGRVYAFGGAAFLGEPKSDLDSAQAVDIVTTPAGNGYWVLDDSGRIHAFGDAANLGEVHADTLPAGERITSLAASPSGGGYWIFTSRGRALAFGDARFQGDMTSTALNAPVVNSIATISGNGYYMIASDGGIFAFGDAVFHGSMGGVKLNGPVEALVPDYDGTGYWLVASDGGIFAFDAPFRGSMGGVPLNKPVRGMVRFGDGYLMVGADGGIFNLSDRPFFGSLGAHPPDHPIVAVSVLER